MFIGMQTCTRQESPCVKDDQMIFLKFNMQLRKTIAEIGTGGASTNNNNNSKMTITTW